MVGAKEMVIKPRLLGLTEPGFGAENPGTPDLLYFVKFLLDSVYTRKSLTPKPVTPILPHPPFGPAQRAVLSRSTHSQSEYWEAVF